MNDNVVSFPSKKDTTIYQSGTALCISCKHEWQARAPEGTDWLECPCCGCWKGKFKYPVYRQPEIPYWRCGCNNDLFYINPDGVYCPNCGKVQVFPKNV